VTLTAAADSFLAASSGLLDRRARLEKPTSSLRNRVWGFSAKPKGRLLGSHPLRRRTAIGYRGYRYKTASGRRNFLQSDPISFAGGDINIYRYVGNGVLVFVDPFGLCRIWTITEKKGDVWLFDTKTKNWSEANVGDEVTHGVNVVTFAESRAELVSGRDLGPAAEPQSKPEDVPAPNGEQLKGGLHLPSGAEAEGKIGRASPPQPPKPTPSRRRIGGDGTVTRIGSHTTLSFDPNPSRGGGFIPTTRYSPPNG